MFGQVIMKKEDILALSLGLGLPILVLVVVVTLTYFIRQYYVNYRGGLYNRVKHSLDDEEITITYSSVDVTSENKADRAMNKMMGKKTVESEMMEEDEE